MADDERAEEGREGGEGPKPAPDQAELNMRVYERVLGLCLESAERLDRQHFELSSHERVLRLAEAMFKRFCSDQTDLASAGQRTREMFPMIRTLQNAMENRLY